ncbi:unnamed protein product [Urochloa humidicola]
MAGSMETGVKVLPTLTAMVGMFAVTSAVLGFTAESESLTKSDIHVSGNSECVYPANLAHALGVCAMLLLMVAQIIASAGGVCCQPGGDASNATRRGVGIVVFILSWIMTGIAVRYYCQGVEWNTPGTRHIDFAAGKECYLKHGQFAKAATLSVVAAALVISSCFLMRAPIATPELEEGTATPELEEGTAEPKLDGT